MNSAEAAHVFDQQLPRIVVAKVGLGGHDRGVKVVACALRDAGAEVIYTGYTGHPRRSSRVRSERMPMHAVCRILSGAHMTLVPRIVELLQEHEASDGRVVLDGTIPDDDAAELRRTKVTAVFGPGTRTDEIVSSLLAGPSR